MNLLEITDGQMEFARFKHDKSVDNHIDYDTSRLITTKTCPTVTGCAYLCHVMRTCAAFYYTPSSQECRMLNNSRNYLAVMHIQNGTRYFQSDDVSADTETTERIPHTDWKMIDTGDTFTSPNTGSNFNCKTIHTDWTELNYKSSSPKKYKFFTDEELNQARARDLCNKKNARLPTFITKQKFIAFQKNVLEVCSNLGSVLFWVDGDNRLDASGSYKTWNNNVVPDEPDMWFNGRPENRTNRHCLRIGKLKQEFKLVTSVCEETNAKTICEK
ncbi:hypothetical protein ACF0H5_019515 [Mactra antiquata]